ncbi:hypothetical protein K7X08_024737 [Anisodus acutangulus]|uniref:Uncharacterized protein n=1 Tax=Anisodus acutangulus TaxID=402998 RepID=A0A9Q1M8F6_9SOLA|nr:hypothetical protein K7X08_024737 [Anisodus acutangulus]
MQFSRGGKNVVCEDYFDNMIVFSDAWWIGRKDENPEEARLEFPKELNVQQEKLECDFKGGAGATCVKNEQGQQEKKINFAEPSSGDDLGDNEVETSEEEEKSGSDILCDDTVVLCQVAGKITAAAESTSKSKKSSRTRKVLLFRLLFPQCLRKWTSSSLRIEFLKGKQENQQTKGHPTQKVIRPCLIMLVLLRVKMTLKSSLVHLRIQKLAMKIGLLELLYFIF